MIGLKINCKRSFKVESRSTLEIYIYPFNVNHRPTNSVATTPNAYYKS